MECGFGMSVGGFDIWLVAGPVEHWRFGLRNGIWGASEGLKRRWGEDPRPGDIFFFYVLNPVKRVVGYGIFRGMGLKKKDKWIWKKEKEERENIYKYVPYFSDLRSVVRPDDPEEEWVEKGVDISDECPAALAQRAFTRVRGEQCVEKLRKCKEYIDNNSVFELKEPNYELLNEILEKEVSAPPVEVVVEDVWDASKVIGKVGEVGLEVDSGVIYSVVSALEMGKNVILVGSPGTGKTTLAKVLAEALNFDLVVRTATSEWSRTDVVGGPVFIGGEVAWRSGALIEAIAKGFDAKGRGKFGVLLLIDEINRANMDRAFGEFFTIFGSSDPSEWELPSSILEEIEAFEDKNLDEYARRLLSLWRGGKFKGRFGGLRLPDNFRVIATMNTYDRRYLFTLGYALLRRFAVVDVPNPEENRRLDVVKSQLVQFDFPEEEIEEAFSSIEGLMKVAGRELGIAIIIDTVRHALTVKKHSRGDLSEALDVAIAASVVPQLEGIPLNRLKKFVGECRNRGYVRSARLIEEYYPEVRYSE